jgi:hypothetical protein
VRRTDITQYRMHLAEAADQPADTLVAVRFVDGIVSWAKLSTVRRICLGAPASHIPRGTLSKAICEHAILELTLLPASELKRRTVKSCTVCLSNALIGGAPSAGWQWRCLQCGAGFNTGDEGLDVFGLWYVWHRSKSDPRLVAVGPFWDRGRRCKPARRPLRVVNAEDVGETYFRLSLGKQREFLVHLLFKDDM